MVHKKETLQGLLDVIDKVCSDENNSWFTNELAKRFIVDHAYLTKVLGSKFKSEAIKHYTFIKDPKLKKELCRYYKEMRISYLIGNYPRYSHHLTLQLETLFTYLIVKLNAWQIIKDRSSDENTIKKNGTDIKPTNLTKSFFNNDGTNRDIIWVDYRSKALFCLTYFKIEHGKYWWNFENIYSLRNYISHTTISSSPIHEEKIFNLMLNFPSDIGFYEGLLKEYMNCGKKHFNP